MAKQHGKDTVVKVDSTDLSTYCNTSELNRTADTHDVTGYGADAHAKSGGLLDGTFSMGGVYDTTAATGPRAKLEPLLGTSVAIVRQPEGTGSGLPQDAFNGVMNSYVETNPVADMVTWSAEFEINGDVNSAAQSA